MLYFSYTQLCHIILFSFFLLDVPFQVQFRASSCVPVNGLSVTLTCTAKEELSPAFRFILVNGSSSVIVQDGSSTNYTTFPLYYKDYNNYKATFQCISYNRAGESPPQTLVLDIQGNSYFPLMIVGSMGVFQMNLICASTSLIRNEKIRSDNLHVVNYI